MPRVARFQIAALGELFRQLMYAPPVARRRQMEAAEQLVAQIDPQQVYPEEFIIFRITGYRPDLPDEPVGLVGEALVADLVTLIQRLSQGLDLSPEHDDRTPVTLDDLARRLNISARRSSGIGSRGWSATMSCSVTGRSAWRALKIHCSALRAVIEGKSPVRLSSAGSAKRLCKASSMTRETFAARRDCRSTPLRSNWHGSTAGRTRHCDPSCIAMIAGAMNRSSLKWAR